MADVPAALLGAPEAPLLLPPPDRPDTDTGTGSGSGSGSAAGRHPKRNLAIALAALLAIGFGVGWFLHHRSRHEAEEASRAQRDALPAVTVVVVQRSPGLSELLLPGSLSPVTEAALYARAAGYVRHRYADIGDSVRKGQVLADIESPELDAQVEQGRAALAQARQQLNQARTSVNDAQAKLDLAQATLARYQALLAQDATTPLMVDEQRQADRSAVAALAAADANVGAAVQNVQAARANLQRLVALQAFEQLRAPFDGIITARNVDEGALISNAGASLTSTDVSSYSSTGGSSASTSTGSATGGTSSTGSSSGSGTASSGGQGAELFRIAQIDRLRVFVTVPQESAGNVQAGQAATVFVQAFGADGFGGRVSRTAGALDPTARTLLTEVQIGNPGHRLMPGMYAQVRFSSQRSAPPLLVPGEALITRSAGTFVAAMQEMSAPERQKLPASPHRDQARRVHLQPVVIGRDYGTEVEISGGLKGGEELVINPGDEVQEGAVMVPQAPASASGDAASAPAKGQSAPAALQPPVPPSAPAASAPAGAASSPVVGPSDQNPTTLGSPSMTAPMQGNPNKGGAKSGGGKPAGAK